MTVLNMFDLTGRTALVTGGAGLYGRQIVRALAEAGATTYMASRNRAALQQVSDEFVANGLDVRAVVLDQGDEASVLRARDEVAAATQQLDILVNNAVARTADTGMGDDVSTWEESLRINGAGLMTVTRAFAELMPEGGSIINIGSIMGLIGTEPLNYEGTTMHGWYPDYFFHKGGMANLTRFFASYYGSRGIRCNCLHPGGLDSGQPRAFVENYSKRTCLGRLAGPTDLMGAVVFLAGDASAYITGTNIPVDGGYTAK